MRNIAREEVTRCTCPVRSAFISTRRVGDTQVDHTASKNFSFGWPPTSAPVPSA